MKFIKIENALVNFDNITTINRINEKLIRIFFIDGYSEIRKESEEEINELWEWLEEICIQSS